MLMRILLKYGELVKKRPAVWQIATAGVITTAGDIIAQKCENPHGSFNYRRTAVMSTLGFCFFGPFVSAWLILIKRLNMSVISTVALDQAFAAPFFTSGFVFMHPILSGKSVAEAKVIYKTTFLEIMKKGWMLWIPAQSVNFGLVPFEFRMLFMQVVSLLWNGFLSYRSNVSLQEQ